jgi:hypothetical protein
MERFMKFDRSLVAVICLTIVACKGEPKPELDIDGHWIVDHGFYEDCQVIASFTDATFTLTFQSLSENACQPELFGVQGDSVSLQIDSRDDFFNGEGALTAELVVSSAAYSAGGTMQLSESGTGLTGIIIDAYDPADDLQLLIDRPYGLLAADTGILDYRFQF